jgi:hypothetical protein
MQPIHRAEIKTLPSSVSVVQGQVEQGKHRVIDVGLIVFHAHPTKLVPSAHNDHE